MGMNADLDENAGKKEIIEDANSMQEYLAEEAREEIADVARDISDNMRGIAEEVEKEVLDKKLHIQATTDELEAAEIDVAIKDAVSDMHKKEETEMNKVENEMNDRI